MVDTIASVVDGGRRKLLAAIAHVTGATIGAAAVGAVLGALGALAGGPWGRTGLIVVVIAAAVFSLRDAASLPIPLPERKGQVPSWWRAFFGPPVASGLYGVVLGLGFATHLTYGTFVVACAGAVVSGHLVIGALICAPFGLARGLVVVAIAARHGRDLQKIEEAATRRVARPLAAAASIATGLASLISLYFAL